jgi:hypothetical protein
MNLLKLTPLRRVAALLGCVTLVATAVIGSSASPVNAATCKRHKFYVTPDPYTDYAWSVYGDLYSGDGQRVYHWQEEGKPPGQGYVDWEYTYCGDGGWAHIWIYPDPRKGPYTWTGLDLNYGYWWKILKDESVILEGRYTD